jgi:hypothetical protein
MVSYKTLNVGEPLSFVFQAGGTAMDGGHRGYQCGDRHSERIARLSGGPAAYMDEHEPRRAAATYLLAYTSEVRYTPHSRPFSQAL